MEAVLQAGLALRNRRDDGALTDHGLASVRGRLLARLGRLIDAPPPLDDAERFAAHLDTEFAAVFAFLWDPSVDATNWRAEQAIRPAVVTRKVCGGNRTRHGAEQVLTIHREQIPHGVSVLGTVQAVEDRTTGVGGVCTGTIELGLQPRGKLVEVLAVRPRPAGRGHEATPELAHNVFPEFRLVAHFAQVQGVECETGRERALVVAGDALAIDEGPIGRRGRVGALRPQRNGHTGADHSRDQT